MLTRDDYRRAVFQAHCWTTVGIFLILALPLLGAVISHWLRTPGAQSVVAMFPAAIAQQLGSLIFLGGFVLGMAASLFCLVVWQSDVRLRCPHCRHLRMNQRLALGTEHCDTCGRPVPFARPLNVKSPPPPTPATADDPSLPSVDEFRRDVGSYFWYSVYVVLIPTSGILFASLALVVGVLLSRVEPPPAPRVRMVGVERWLVIASVVSPAMLYAVVAVCRWRRPPLLTCPRCRRALIQRRSAVIASRHCSRCGVRVLRDRD